MTPYKTKQQPVGVCDLDGTFDEAVVVCSIAVPCCMRGAVCSTQALRTTTAGVSRNNNNSYQACLMRRSPAEAACIPSGTQTEAVGTSVTATGHGKT